MQGVGICPLNAMYTNILSTVSENVLAIKDSLVALQLAYGSVCSAGQCQSLSSSIVDIAAHTGFCSVVSNFLNGPNEAHNPFLK